MNDKTLIDKVIRTLYLAASNERDVMLRSLIGNVIYSYGEGLPIDGIIDLIEEEYSLTPLTYEIEGAIEEMITSEYLKKAPDDEKFILTKRCKKIILTRELEKKRKEDNRFEHFRDILEKINTKQLNEFEEKFLWTEFNHYTYSCFLEHGRSAIDIFLPLEEVEESIYQKQVKESLSRIKTHKNQELELIFANLIKIYPDELSEDEINHLDELALQAERFFSLGLKEEDYEKTQQLNLDEITIFLDTNFLYSALELHNHSDNRAVKQIIDLIKFEHLKIKLKFIPKTYEELKFVEKNLPTSISRVKFTHNQIKALLASDDLDSFARVFFEKKLKDAQTPHPVYILTNSLNILKSKGIIYHNSKFPYLDDFPEYLEAKVKEFYRFEELKNKVRRAKGLPPKGKSKKIIEHDVYLREVLSRSRKEKVNIDELKYISITLDKYLIDFDRFLLNSPGSRPADIKAPHFMTPSIFLRKIRAFIPAKTKNYKQAFVSSITAYNIDHPADSQKSSLVQKSIEFFRKLGIDDEKVILEIIKKELFLKEFKENLDKEEGESFIQSEVDKTLQLLKVEKELLEQKETETQKKLEEAQKKEVNLQLKLNEESTQRKEQEKLLNSQNQAIIKLLEKQGNLSKDNGKLEENNHLLQYNINELTDSLQNIKKHLITEKAKDTFEQRVIQYEKKFHIYAEEEWKKEVKQLFLKLVFYSFFLIFAVISFILSFFYSWMFIALLIFLAPFVRAFFDHKAILTSILIHCSEKKMSLGKKKFFSNVKTTYESKNPLPNLIEITEEVSKTIN